MLIQHRYRYLQNLAFMVLLGLLQACSCLQGGGKSDDATPASPKSTLDAVRERGVLRVGLDIFEPWAMRDEKGEWIGSEVEVAKQLAADLGVHAAFVPTPWKEIFEGLLQDRYDIIICGLSITPERALRVAFSNPYAESMSTILANRLRAEELRTVEEYNLPIINIAVQRNTVSAAVAADRFPRANLVQFDDTRGALEAVLQGNVHAMIASSPLPELESMRHGDRLFLPLEKPLSRTVEAFAVRRGDLELLQFLNAWIFARTADGWLARQRRFWFWSLDWEPLLEGER